MKTTRPYPSLLVAAAFAALLLFTAMSAPLARADGRETSTIKFSDAAKPGTLKVSLAMGDIKITGSDTATEITVQTEMQSDKPTPRKDGMRVLSESATFSLTEKDNVVTLDAGHELTFGGDSSFEITVPRNTSVVVTNSFGGEIHVGQVTGDIEIKSLNGEVHLADVTGGALVETMNGEIKANITALKDGKPLSFTSMNGEIALHVPTAAKANVRLRTQNGAILTDFDDKALVTKTESVRSGKGKVRRVNVNPTVDLHIDDNAEIRQAVREAVRAGMAAAREATEAMREAAQAAREAAEEARAEAQSEDSAVSIAPIPPLAPLPPMTGGKLVSGTLNGGGTEIYAAAMNGDVVLRKSE